MERVRSTITIYVRGEDKGESRIGFTHKEFAPVRRIVVREWFITSSVLFVSVLAILSIYWGAFIHVEQNMKSFNILVVNMDGGDPDFVGSHVTRLAKEIASSDDPHLGFEVIPPEQFDFDYLNVRRAVFNFEAWGAITVHSNASSSLQKAVEVGDGSYYPDGAAEIVYVQARDPNAMPDYVIPGLNEFALQAVAQVGESWTRSVLKNSTIQRKNLAAAPQALSPAIGFTTVDLRPLGPPQVVPAITVGSLYLIVVSFFSFAFFLPTHTHFISEFEGHRKLFFYQLVFWKYLSAFWAYFFLSLSYSLVSLAFQIPFSNPTGSDVEPAINPNAYGHATFVVYWMVNWLGMLALGLASENMAMVLGQPWAAIWLIFWIISNVCVAIYPINLAPRFYYYGYAFPLHNSVEASKQVLFDLHSRIGLNVGILCAWVAVNTAFFPLCAWFFRYKYFKRKEKADKKKQQKS